MLGNRTVSVFCYNNVLISFNATGKGDTGHSRLSERNYKPVHPDLYPALHHGPTRSRQARSDILAGTLQERVVYEG